MIRHLPNIAFLLAVILFFPPQMLCQNQVVAVFLSAKCLAILKGTATRLLEARTRAPPHLTTTPTPMGATIIKMIMDRPITTVELGIPNITLLLDPQQEVIPQRNESRRIFF